MLPPPGQIPPWRSQISMLDPFNTITEQIKRTKSLMSERERFHHRRSTRHPKLDSLVTVTLENYLSFGLGTGLLGGTITRLGCANGVGKGLSFKPCPNAGAISCLTCNLVKYCSDECQRQHWSRHRSSCLSPFLDPHWLPSWITEGRKPTFLARRRHSYQHTTTWDDGVPAYDCLKLVINEGFDPDRDYKLCFSASGDIRHLIKTVNSLPKVYRGQCDILLNDVDSFVSNRNLVILKVLLSPGPTLDEVAEAVLHLMYSAALTESIYAYAQKCIRALYDDGICHEGDILFRRSFKTRGLGRLSTMQVASGIKKLKGVFTSQKYCLANATAERQAVVLNPMEEDDRQRRLVDMKPHQRPAVQRFWERGILVPYGVDTHHFVHPNPLLFSSEGDWLGGTDLTILQSWDVSDVIQVDSKYNVPASDIFGCFFFYIKHQLKEFARRVKEFNLNIHITQFDSRVLAKGLSAGVLGSFNGPVFDRVDLGALMDIESIGLKGALDDWGKLLDDGNESACLIVHSKKWWIGRKDVVNKDESKLFRALLKKCIAFPELQSPLQGIFEYGIHSPSLFRLIDTTDAFVDHEPAFRRYIYEREREWGDQGLDAAGAGPQAQTQMRLRRDNTIHPKRFGVSLDTPQQRLPNLAKEEFYNLFILGGLQHTVRFAEFELRR